MKSINDELHGPVEALLTLTTLCRSALDFVRDSLGPKSQGSIRNRVRLGCSATHLFTVNELQFPVEGALLEGGEEGVEFAELGAHPCLLRFHLLHDGREALLEV